MSSCSTIPIGSIFLISISILLLFLLLNFKNKFIKYFLILVVIYFLNYIFIGLNTAQQTCLPDRINYSIVGVQSIWAPLMSILILIIINLSFLFSFFQQPFIEIFGNLYGSKIAEGVNVMGICWAGCLLTYFNIKMNGCKA
jgi:hypothetical protein